MALLLKDIFAQSVEFLAEHEIFFGHGVEVAEDEVVLLFMYVMQVDFSALNEMSEETVSVAQQGTIKTMLDTRVTEKTPMVYLVGFAIYAGLKFKVDSRVLIPRSPFVELIDGGFEPWVDLTESMKVMDLCTGSGCIGLAIAHYFRAVDVDLVDLSPSALQLAQHNTEALKLSDRVRCVESDLFGYLNEENHPGFGLIVANPPYVAEDEYRDLPAEYLHEPKMALVSEKLGMELPVKILLKAADYLTEAGMLFLEVGYNDEVLEQCLPDVSFEWLDFVHGGQGICVFTRADLLKYRIEFKQFLESHVA